MIDRHLLNKMVEAIAEASPDWRWVRFTRTPNGDPLGGWRGTPVESDFLTWELDLMDAGGWSLSSRAIDKGEIQLRKRAVGCLSHREALSRMLKAIKRHTRERFSIANGGDL